MAQRHPNSRRHCPHGHDTHRVGRDSQHKCLACKRLYRRLLYLKNQGVYTRYPLPNLRQLRESRGMTQAQLSRTAGITPETLRFLERGETRAIARTVLKLSAALQTDPRQLTEPLKSRSEPVG